jgi:hypothetical protein
MQWPLRLSATSERVVNASPTLPEPSTSARVAGDFALVDAPREGLEPARVLLADADLAGWVEPHGERMTDILQRSAPLAFLPVLAGSEEWVQLATRDLYAVVPPPHVSPPEFRVHRQRQQVHARVGRYGITGIAHLRAGEERDPLLRATKPFLPLTDATLVIDDNESAPLHFEVLIINLEHVGELIPV